jgi:hypothetical protein
MRRWLLTAGAVAAAGGAIAAGVVIVTGDDPSPAAATTAPTPQSFAAVTRRDLVRNEELDGVVGHGDQRDLPIALEGTLTSLPSPGDVLEQGSVVAGVDGQPVVALDGDVPMWRDLGSGVDDGVDVLQLEQALAALGFAQEYDVTVDGDWTDATTRAVTDFQEANGMTEDGQLAKGEVVFIPEPVRVAAVGGVAGQASTEAAIEVTSQQQAINADVALEDATLLAAGDVVTVELPDGSTVEATVAEIGAAQTDEQGTTTVPVAITTTEPLDLPTGTPVDVLVGVVSAENVLAVPVEAVLAVAEGGYAVEVRDGSSTRLVGVELGAFADGMVEITGDVAEGDEVVVP